MSSTISGLNTVETERVYVRMGGRNIGEKRETLTFDRYDSDGRLVEYVEYGNGHKKTVYTYKGDVATSEVRFFDSIGGPMKESDFESRFDGSTDADLCPKYTVRQERDTTAKVDRQYEICLDGSSRATTIDELDQEGNVVRSVRTDARSRKWEEVHEYDSSGNLTEYRFTVAVGPKPAYTHTIKCSDYKFDERGNWVRMTATTFVSTMPDILVYQYNEHRKMSYYPDAKK